jgi:hypothetical protein
MKIEHESANFMWCYDSLSGVGRFIRKSDNAVSFLETGTDCQEVRRQLNRLAQKTSSPKYPNAAPGFASVFDAIADQYEFHED